VKLSLNGSLMEPEAARIAPGDRGFTLGDGLFETLRVKAGRIQRRDAHLARLARGAAVLALPLPALDLAAVLEEVRAANGLEEGSLRLTVTRGEGPRGVLPPPSPQPTVLVTAAPLASPAAPARLILARRTRRNEFSPLAGVKSLNYLDNILARQEAAEAGADDAILLNTRGSVAETSIANLFAVIGGRLLTPLLTDGVLPGIMRAAVLALEGTEETLTPADLARADEVLLTSSLGIRSVALLEGRPLGADTLARRLRAALGED